MQIDMDERIEGMCEKCKVEVNDSNKCNRCGDKLEEIDNNSSINNSFDDSRFKELAGDL